MPESMAQSSTEVHKRAGLRNEADMPRRGRGGGETGVQMDAGHHDPQAVRPENSHPGEFALLDADQFFQLAAGLADFAESGRDDDDSPRAGFAQQPHQFRNAGGGRADDRQVGRMGQAGDILVRLNSLHRLPFGIDRINHARETRSDQVPQHGISDARRRIARADHGHSGRIENFVEIANTHETFLKKLIDCPNGLDSK